MRGGVNLCVIMRAGLLGVIIRYPVGWVRGVAWLLKSILFSEAGFAVLNLKDTGNTIFGKLPLGPTIR